MQKKLEDLKAGIFCFVFHHLALNVLYKIKLVWHHPGSRAVFIFHHCHQTDNHDINITIDQQHPHTEVLASYKISVDELFDEMYVQFQTMTATQPLWNVHGKRFKNQFHIKATWLGRAFRI
jgi:hypothetical protein